MIYAQFYHESTGWNGKDFTGPVRLIPECGSDSVIILDGRWSLARQISEATRVGLQRKAKGFTICAGRTYCDSREVSKLRIFDRSQYNRDGIRIT